MTVYYKKKSLRSFTLVELLVVVAIISVLAAVGYGSLLMALKRANMSKCSANLHQIGIGMLSFAGDNNNTLPESGATILYNQTDPTTGKNGWTQQLSSYVGTDTNIFQCPDSVNVHPENKPYSYFNGAHAAYSANGHAFAAVNLMQMKSPSQHIIAGDIAFDSTTTPSEISFQSNDADKDDYTQDPAFNGGTITTPTTIPIHMGSVNILFADGHVQNCKYFDPSSMTTVYSGVNSTNVYLQ